MPLLTLFFLILGMINGIPEEGIIFEMDVWVEPEYKAQWVIVKLYVVDFDIPGQAAYYSQLHGRIVIEDKSLRPTVVLPSGKCYNNLWHEILHVKWNNGEIEDHMRMAKENHCA